MSDDSLLTELLAKPIGPATPARTVAGGDFTNKIEVTRDQLTATICDQAGLVNEGRALRYIEDEGQDPGKWEVSSWYKVEYGPKDPVFDANGEPILDDAGEVVTASRMESVKFTFKRKQILAPLEIPVDDLLAIASETEVPEDRPAGDYGLVVLIGDMQFGKIDGDGVAGTVRRTVEAIMRAGIIADSYADIVGHIHVAWLGDHIEGFVSQGGANVWRTQLTLNEQIRLTRRVMLKALTTFAPLSDRVTMAAVPGNHGEPVRFEGKGTTRYDDSHDTEALIAVADTAEMLPDQFGHVDFYVPDTDELIVMTEVAGTHIAHHHGHKWRPQKQWEWWSDQAFNAQSPMHMADILVAGHLHHEHFEINGSRTYWGQPALESESTWYRHAKGVGGAPAINVGLVRDGRVHVRQSIYL